MDYEKLLFSNSYLVVKKYAEMIDQTKKESTKLKNMRDLLDPVLFGKSLF